MATTTQSHTGLRVAGRPVDWGPWLNRLIAIILVAAGLALLSAEQATLPAEWAARAKVAGPLAVMLAGALLASWGWSKPRALPTFALERGAVTCGELAAQAGGSDLLVRAVAGGNHLAVGEFPSRHGPRVDVAGSVARLILEARQVAPLEGGRWSVALAKGMPWDLSLHAGAGHLALDLRELTVSSLRVQADFGDVDLTLPAQGPAEMQLKLGLGDLRLTVPEGVETRLRLNLGALTTVKLDERRFIRVAPCEWMTPLYPTTARRCSVAVDMAVGDLRVA